MPQHFRGRGPAVGKPFGLDRPGVLGAPRIPSGAEVHQFEQLRTKPQLALSAPLAALEQAELLRASLLATFPSLKAAFSALARGNGSARGCAQDRLAGVAVRRLAPADNWNRQEESRRFWCERVPPSEAGLPHEGAPGPAEGSSHPRAFGPSARAWASTAAWRRQAPQPSEHLWTPWKTGRNSHQWFIHFEKHSLASDTF